MDQVIPSIEDPFLTVDEIANIFKVTPYTVRHWCRDGETLHGVKLPNGEWRVLKSEMVRLANAKYGEKK